MLARARALSTGFAGLAPLRPWAGQSHAGVPEIDSPAQDLSGGFGVFWVLLECGFGARVRCEGGAGFGYASGSRYDFCYGVVYQCEEGGGAGGRFLVPQHETAGLTPLFTASDPSAHSQTAIKKPAEKGGFLKRQR